MTRISSWVSHYKRRRCVWSHLKKATMKFDPWFNRMLMRVKGWSRLTLGIIFSLRKCSGSETNRPMLFTLRRDKWLTKALRHLFMSMDGRRTKWITGYQTKTIWLLWMRCCKLLAVNHLLSFCKMLRSQTKKRNSVTVSSNWSKTLIVANPNLTRMRGAGLEPWSKISCT